MDLNTATLLIASAQCSTFAALCARSRGGYLADLRPSADDAADVRRAKVILHYALGNRGLPSYYAGYDDVLVATAAGVLRAAAAFGQWWADTTYWADLNLTPAERARLAAMLTPNMDNDRPG